MSTAVASIDVSRRSGKFLTFYLGGEEYGVEILKVHEIIGMLAITRIPRAPEYIRGVVNLRGKVIPIMDLRLRFGMEAASADENCIIVVQVRGVQIGIVVDQVSEVANIGANEVEDTPSFGSDVQTDFLLGIAKSEGHVKLLLDIDKVLSTAEVAQVAGVQAEAA